jgi:GT2 family glycosyltransferase
VAETPGKLAALVVTHESSHVIHRCLRALLAAAPKHGVEPWVVDNASTDDSAAAATTVVGPSRVMRLEANRGFAAGVNAGCASIQSTWLAVLNPDVILPAGSLDRLVDILEQHPRAGLVAPRVFGTDGRPEANVGRFPSVTRERNHAWMLDRWLGQQGRHAPFPSATRRVDWVSGCCWLLRSQAMREVGALDEEYFMYFEDVDYCKRLHVAGWDVIATPAVEVRHELGRGSRTTRLLPADGGRAPLRYFAKFHSREDVRRVRGWLVRGWRLRHAWRRLRARLGDAGSSVAAERYRLALRSVDVD